jgi:hypothetical protein
MQDSQNNELFLLMQNREKFPDSQVLKSAGTEDIFKFVLNGLKDAAVGKIKEVATGWIMDLLGMGPGPDPLDEIKRQLEQQAAELKKIQGKIDDLNTAMSKAFKEILDVVEKGQYDSAVRGLNPAIAKITSRYDRLVLLAKTANPDPAKKETIKQLADDIISEIPEAFDAIHATLIGTAAGDENVLDFWARLSFKNTISIDAYEQKINAQFMYYYGLQVKALMLIMEAYHFDKKDTAMAQHYFNLWAGKMNEEILVYLKNAPRTTIKNMFAIKGAPVNIIVESDTIHYTTGKMQDAKLITLKKADNSETNSQVPESSRGAYYITKHDGFIYMVTMDADMGALNWNILKIKPGSTPTLVKRLFCQSPGDVQPAYRMVFPTAVAFSDNTMYISFVGSGLEGIAFSVIDLDTFSFANDKGFGIRQQIKFMGGFDADGGAVYGDKFYTTIGQYTVDKNTLKTIDLKRKSIIKSTDFSAGQKSTNSGFRFPMVIQDNYLYCTAGDTWLHVFDITDPGNPIVAGAVDTNAQIADLHVDGSLIYFTNYFGDGFDIDDRGNINVAFFTARSGGVLSKSAKIGDGIHAIGMDKHTIYAGSGKDQSKMYVLSYANDMTKNIMPVPTK